MYQDQEKAQEQVNRVLAVHKAVLNGSEKWPRRDNRFGGQDNHAVYLEMLFARALGGREILLATGQVDGSRYEAVIFTENLIFAGSVDVVEQPIYPPRADVSVFPWSAVKAVALLELDNYGELADERLDAVAFTVSLDDKEPIRINPMKQDHQRYDGKTSRLFDALLEVLSARR
jgi:hypothetical protein